MIKEHHITPVAKPRMTQCDKWKQRPVVMKYWAYKDECVGKGVSVPDKVYICFMMPMPKTWSRAKRDEMYCQPHKQKPDLDNLIKGLLDAVLEDDSTVSEIHAKKLWGHSGAILIDKMR